MKRLRSADFLVEVSLVGSRSSFAIRPILKRVCERLTTNDDQRRTETELWLLQRISAFWKRRSANQAPKTPPGGYASAEKFQLSCTARAKTRLPSRSIRGRCCASCGRRAGTTRFLTWRSTAIA